MGRGIEDSGMMGDGGEGGRLTGNGAQHVRDKGPHQRLVQHVVTAAHPQGDRLEAAQRHQLAVRDVSLRVLLAAGTRAGLSERPLPDSSGSSAHGYKTCIFPSHFTSLKA